MVDTLKCNKADGGNQCLSHLGCVWSVEKEQCTLDRTVSFTYLLNIRLLDGLANEGGGACIRNADVVMSNCELVANHALYGGGLSLLEKSTATVKNGLVITMNIAELNGGGVMMRSNTKFNTTVQEKVLGGGGGGSDLGTIIDRNVAWLRGGGAYMEDADVFASGVPTEISRNIATNGAGLYIKGHPTSTGAATRVSNMNVHHNWALEYGGGTSIVSSSVSVTDVNYKSNVVYDCLGRVYIKYRPPECVDSSGGLILERRSKSKCEEEPVDGRYWVWGKQVQ
jgi:hypothetical protein